MNYFVSGGTGYIGSWLVKNLLDQGHTVHALVRNPAKAKIIAHPNLLFFETDIMDRDAIFKAMRNCDYAFHLAAFAKVWAKDPKTFFDLNVVATNYVLDAAK